MTVKELIRRLKQYPSDYDVIIVDEHEDGANRLLKAEDVDDWKHFQTDEYLGGVILSGSTLI